MKRLMAVPMSLELWQGMMTEGYRAALECTKGLPEGAELVSSYYDGERGRAVLIFHHESFDPIPEGGTIPTLLPEFKDWMPEIRASFFAVLDAMGLEYVGPGGKAD
jgi:hypothetical protein